MPLPTRLVIATHNNGKLREFAALLSPYIPEIVSAGQLGLPSPEETGVTFAENAIIKAKAAAKASGSLALADDSGLCIKALNGQPGLFSARWAEPGIDIAMRRVLDGLEKTHDRSAYFICALALYWPDDKVELIEGRINGSIALAPRGNHGHGYDPLFIPHTDTRSFAEMEESEKNVLSHRGQATRALVNKFIAASKT